MPVVNSVASMEGDRIKTGDLVMTFSGEMRVLSCMTISGQEAVLFTGRRREWDWAKWVRRPRKKIAEQEAEAAPRLSNGEVLEVVRGEGHPCSVEEIMAAADLRTESLPGLLATLQALRSSGEVRYTNGLWTTN